MIPVDQTLFGVPDGNCYPACIASILELPLETVPHFCRDYHYWQQASNEWLATMGLGFVCVHWPPFDATALPECICILNGKSPRGFHHSVVGRLHRNLEPTILHDPHHSRKGLIKITSADLFVTIDPKKARHVCNCLQCVCDRTMPPKPQDWTPSVEFNMSRGTPRPDERS